MEASGGWIVGLCYLAGSVACLRTGAALTGAPKAWREQRVWWAIAALLAILGIGRQFDLQTGLVEAGRFVLLDLGLYRPRRYLQVALIAAAAAAALACAAGAILFVRGMSLPARAAVAAAGLLAGTVFVEAVSLHDVDRLAAMSVFGIRWNWLIEAAGIAAVAVAALYRGRVSGR